MSRKEDEKQVFATLTSAQPEFLERGLAWEEGPANGSPDFVGVSRMGRRYGVELTEWLHPDQTTRSVSNAASRQRLLAQIRGERLSLPVPLTRVLICDNERVALKGSDIAAYVQELRKLIEQMAPRWERNQFCGIWGNIDFSPYSVLSKYCSALRCMVLHSSAARKGCKVSAR